MSSIATLLDCGGERHRVLWNDGALSTPDHADADGERTLAALGGTTCPCIEALDAWSRHGDDPTLLTALTRGPGETVERPQRPRSGWVAYAPMQRGPRPGGGRAMAVARSAQGPAGVPADEGRDDLAVLYSLGPALGARLVAAVTRRCLTGVAAGETGALPALRASLAGRAGLALALWTDGAPVRVEAAAAGELPSLHQDGDGLVAVLGLSWVAEVWGRGLSTVGDRFVVDAEDGRPGEIVLSGIGPDLGDPATISVRIDE